MRLINIVVEHNFTLAPTMIEVSKEHTSFDVNQGLDVNDIIVKATYADGYIASIQNYVTNASEIDMSTPGEKTLTVTYAENGKTLTMDIVITVNALDIPPTGDTTNADMWLIFLIACGITAVGFYRKKRYVAEN